VSELIIDESNFSEYFFDVRQNTPQRGQVMARYSAGAEFVDGRLKQDIIDLVRNKDKAAAASRVMRKLGCATEADSFRIPREIAEDLLSGMTAEQVEQKAYKYTIEAFYYTEKQHIPLDDPHWSVISLSNLDEFLDAADNKLKIRSKIVDEKKADE
jgi:hypothetical protein